MNQAAAFALHEVPEFTVRDQFQVGSETIMHPRGILDIGWSDLIFAWRSALGPGNPDKLEREIAEYWESGQNYRAAGVLATLSVRTGFDALLQAVDLPPGSEILMSAITIQDMARIAEAHELIPVPVDMDMETLSISMESFETVVSPKSRMIVVAHIFGSRMPLDDLIAQARIHNLLVVEDCAQAYSRRSDRGSTGVDVSMFSFGPIKTNTALAGGILEFADPKLCELTSWVLGNYPRQDYRQFRRRVMKYLGIKVLTLPFVFGVFVRVCRLLGASYDSVIGGSLRSFPGTGLLTRIRRRPSAPLLALLRRRITTYDDSRTEARVALADRIVKSMPGVRRPGEKANAHSHWVFPIYADEPEALKKRLQLVGFDATQGASGMNAIEVSTEGSDLSPRLARSAMDRILYLPVSAHLGEQDIARLAEICNKPARADAYPSALL